MKIMMKEIKIEDFGCLIEYVILVIIVIHVLLLLKENIIVDYVDKFFVVIVVIIELMVYNMDLHHKLEYVNYVIN